MYRFFFYYKVEHRHAFCLDMSIRGKAAFAAANAPSTMASGPPTKVYTVRLVDSPGSTSSNVTPGAFRMASAMASITFGKREYKKS